LKNIFLLLTRGLLTLSAGLNTNRANPTSRVESLFSGPIRPKAATGGGVATLKNKFPPYFFVPPIRVVFSLLLVLLLSSRVKSQEYILLLNPGDCFKSNVAFAELQHFLNNHQIRVALLTPFEDQINAKLLMENVFQWAREEHPLQPLTVSAWHSKLIVRDPLMRAFVFICLLLWGLPRVSTHIIYYSVLLLSKNVRMLVIFAPWVIIKPKPILFPSARSVQQRRTNHSIVT